MKPEKGLLALLLVTATLLFSSFGTAQEMQDEPPSLPLTVIELPEFRVAKGEILYRHYCSFCHGDTGAGDGLNAYSMKIKPRNFTDESSMSKKTDNDLVNAITSGGQAQGLSNFMPAFGNTLSEKQVNRIVNYIRIIVRDS